MHVFVFSLKFDKAGNKVHNFVFVRLTRFAVCLFLSLSAIDFNTTCNDAYFLLCCSQPLRAGLFHHCIFMCQVCKCPAQVMMEFASVLYVMYHSNPAVIVFNAVGGSRCQERGFRPWSQIRWSQLFVSCPGGPSIVRSPSFQMSWEAEFCERCCRVTSLASLMKLKSRFFLHSALRTASCRIRVSFFSAVYFAVLSCETGRLSCLCVKYCNINIFRADCFLFDK